MQIELDSDQNASGLRRTFLEQGTDKKDKSVLLITFEIEEFLLEPSGSGPVTSELEPGGRSRIYDIGVEETVLNGLTGYY